MAATQFDWLDATTFAKPFEHAFAGGERIAAIYLVAPEVADPVPAMTAFVDFTVKMHGIRRFVLLAGGTAERDGYFVGKLWQYLVDIGVGYCVLRPTWFNGAPALFFSCVCMCVCVCVPRSVTPDSVLRVEQTNVLTLLRLTRKGGELENFCERQNLYTIKEQGKIYTACGDGKVPFVSAADIAAIAYHALVDAEPHNNDYRILGPELLTYDEVNRPLFRLKTSCGR